MLFSSYDADNGLLRELMKIYFPVAILVFVVIATTLSPMRRDPSKKKVKLRNNNVIMKCNIPFMIVAGCNTPFIEHLIIL